MTGLLRRTFFDQETKYVSIYLNDEPKSQVKMGTSGHVVLNDIQWCILVTFKVLCVRPFNALLVNQRVVSQTSFCA